METQLLEAFVAVVDSGSFSGAAENIHLTQPAISKRIALLEEHLACRLFDRIARNISLTEAGAALLPRARALLQELELTRRTIRDLSGVVGGELRLAISHHIGLHRLPPVLKAFANMHPAVKLNIDFMDSEIAYEAVRQGRFELAVITLAPADNPKVLATRIWRDPLQITCARDYPLATRNPLSIDILSDYPAILPDLNTYTGRMIKQFFKDRDKPLNATMATNYLETIKMMVSVGLGWSMLPGTMVSSPLIPLECANLVLERQLGFIQHREKTLSNAARAFIDLLTANGDQSE